MLNPEILEDARKRSGLSEDEAVLLRWENQGYQKRNRKIAQVCPDFFLTSASLAITVGPDIYNLPTDFLRSLRIEDENGNTFDRVNPSDEARPDGWYFYGSVIDAGLRYERIRVQVSGGKPATAATWTLHYVQQPQDLAADSVPNWPTAIHEILVFEILTRWMETDEQSDRVSYYEGKLKDADADFWDIIGDRAGGLPEGIIMKDDLT
jgi:hypothetical protein